MRFYGIHIRLFLCSEKIRVRYISGAGADLGGGCRGCTPTPPPRGEAFFFVFAFKICSPHRSVTSFLRGAPLLRKILHPPLRRFLFTKNGSLATSSRAEMLLVTETGSFGHCRKIIIGKFDLKTISLG